MLLKLFFLGGRGVGTAVIESPPSAKSPVRTEPQRLPTFPKVPLTSSGVTDVWPRRKKKKIKMRISDVLKSADLGSAQICQTEREGGSGVQVLPSL